VAAEVIQPVTADANITESNKATVDAYTEIDTSAKFYDRASSYLEDNLGTYLDFIVTRSGDQIELSNKTLVIDATASSVFAYSDPQVTIKASTYTGDATATTGSVTTLNGSLLSGGTFDCDVNYQSGAGTTLTNVNVNGVLDFDTAGTYTLDGCTITEVTNSSGGAITLSLTNGATVTTNTGPNITLQQSVNITAPSIIDGSRVQIYNVTKSVEIDNSVVSGGSGYSTSVNLLSASVDYGDTIRLRATYTSGTSAKSEALATGILGTNGLSFLTTQDDDTAYNTLALDGSTITKFTADYVNDKVDISIASDFTLAEFYAWWVYNTTTSQGISDFFGGVTAVDEANFKINNTVVSIYLDNATATNISQTDNRRVYRADGARPVVSSTSGGGGIDVEWRSPVTIAASESIQSNLTDILDDTDELQQNQGDWLTATGFSTFDPASDQVIVATNNDKTDYALLDADKDVIVDKVWDEPLTGATHNDPTSAGRRLRQASAWLSAEGQAIGTPTTTSIQTDLTQTTSSFYADQTFVFTSGTLAGQARLVTSYDGTTKTFTFDEPWTLTPSVTDEFAVFADHVHPISQIQAGLAIETKQDAVQSSIDNLNNFDPVNDIVANVTTVQTTVTNSDMRGTDGVPTNPLLINDARLNNLDAAISSRSTLTAAQVDTEITANHGSGSYLTGSGGDSASVIYDYFTASNREDEFKADLSDVATRDNQNVINENVKKSSLIIPASENLPDA
jgi:hypothetical protein